MNCNGFCDDDDDQHYDQEDDDDYDQYSDQNHDDQCSGQNE